MAESTLRHEERIALARLHALLELLPTALDKELSPAGLTSFEFTLLEALSEAEEQRLRLSALASRTNATLPRLSRVVTGLERKGLVRKAPCPEDGRATNARLTEEGLGVYRSSRARYDSAVRRMILDGLDERGVAQLTELTYAILTKLDPDAPKRIIGGEGSEDESRGADPMPPPACPADPAPEPACPADPAK
ncbi:MarR family winged helix-turn-helix transcriptional regulator [Nocardiopsis metallicus]|uniref:DNA-binding MarR family transcriptional regulator n=1 Tax=Nocardiopsis metallicus TaxID=179819 RepID=A0A840WLM6_9ACTN|nr:MarR family transcriptional regulator [Nocardiopsis metallicus]MBB5492725.1 DNA-binding MarR family transcriptional regulator [Nocardiopsis metallicus]